MKYLPKRPYNIQHKYQGYWALARYYNYFFLALRRDGNFEPYHENSEIFVLLENFEFLLLDYD